MNPELAEIYGTVEPMEDDLQKTAAVEMLIKMAEDEGVDLDDFTPDQIEDMLIDLQSDGGEEDFTEKVAEADYLGRVMAHSMTQELGEIEKDAGERWDKYKGKATHVGQEASRLGRRAAAHQLEALKDVGRGVKGVVKGSPLGRGREALKALKGAGKASPTLAAASALGYGGYKGVQALRKKSSIDELAEQRAYEMLDEAGYLEKEASFEDAVEIQALEMLEANGYPVEWE